MILSPDLKNSPQHYDQNGSGESDTIVCYRIDRRYS